MVKSHPYQETLVSSGSTETVIRKFSEYSGSEEFKWHWDEEDRLVHRVHETDWQLQLDNATSTNKINNQNTKRDLAQINKRNR